MLYQLAVIRFYDAKFATVRMEKAVMTRVLHEWPAIAEVFTAFLLARSIETEGDLVDQLFNSSERRLARLLLLLVNFGKKGKWRRSFLLSIRNAGIACWHDPFGGSTSP